VSKRLILHIIFLCVGFTSNSISASVQDSLYIDRSNVQPRDFDNLNEKYTGEDFIYERTVQNSGWWTRFKQWLSDFFRSLFDLETRQQASDLTDLLVKIGAAVIFILVAYFIFKAVMNKEGRWVFGKSSDKNIIPVTDIEQNLSSADFNKLTKEAEKNSNYRLAVRYYYLWLLKKLTAAEIIEYDVEKTNSDYQNEITQTSLKSDFSYTSYLYNYIWYGEFDVNKDEFDQAKHAFTDLLKSIKA